MEREEVEFNGNKYRRYPKGKNVTDRKYFRKPGGCFTGQDGYLHRDIWKYHNGEIPSGYHIHHKDLCIF